MEKETEQVSIYRQWFEAWADSPDRDYHFKNISLCLREDIESGVITAAERDQLAEIYKGFFR